MRTIVIGDIHGAYRALLQVLERADVSDKDHLIFLGDYVDGWSESEKVIELLRELQLKITCTFIRGNHDTWCETWLKSGLADPVWKFHGGASTLSSYAQVDDKTRLKHLVFFNRMKDYYIDSNNNLFIHAGFTSMHGPEKEVYASNYSWDRTLWETALAMDPQITKESAYYPKRLKWFNELFIGHTPTLNNGQLTPMNAANVWNLDTGAAFYGPLSAMDIHTKQLWQSDPVPSLYPGEKGRNKD